MQITVVNDFNHGPNGVNGFTQAEINSFVADETTAVNILQSTFTDNISLTIDVGFGSFNGAQLGNQGVSEGDVNEAAVFPLTYSQLRQDLLNFGQPRFFNAANLPAGNSINGVSNFWVGSSVGAAFGLFTNAVDGFVGIGTGFQAGAERVSAFLHEMGHALGRVPEIINGADSALDLVRFVSQGNRLFDGRTNPQQQGTVPAAYFSIDGGVTDLADWGQNSDPSDFRGPGSNPPSQLTPNDPFDEIVGDLGQLTTVDKKRSDSAAYFPSPTRRRPPAPPPT
jgi:hypothetical protein